MEEGNTKGKRVANELTKRLTGGGTSYIAMDVLVSGFPTSVTIDEYYTLVNNLGDIYGDIEVASHVYGGKIVSIRATEPSMVDPAIFKNMRNLKYARNMMIPILNSKQYRTVLHEMESIRHAFFKVEKGSLYAIATNVLSNLVMKGASLSELDITFYYPDPSPQVVILRNGVYFSSNPLRGPHLNGDVQLSWARARANPHTYAPGVAIMAYLKGFFGTGGFAKGKGKSLDYRLADIGQVYHLGGRETADPFLAMSGLPSGFFSTINVPFTVNSDNEFHSYISGMYPITMNVFRYLRRVRDVTVSSRLNIIPYLASPEQFKRAIRMTTSSGYIHSHLLGGVAIAVNFALGQIRQSPMGHILYRIPTEFVARIRSVFPEYKEEQEYVPRSPPDTEAELVGPDVDGYYYTDYTSFGHLIGRVVWLVQPSEAFSYLVPKWPITRAELEEDEEEEDYGLSVRKIEGGLFDPKKRDRLSAEQRKDINTLGGIDVVAHINLDIPTVVNGFVAGTGGSIRVKPYESY